MADNAIDYAAIRARLDAATPGPWTHEPYGGQNQNGDYSGGCVYDDIGEWVVSEVGDAEGALIAHSRTDLEQLLDRVEELEDTVGRVREAVEEAHTHRFDLDDTATVGPGKPAGGPDIFYNGVGYVVRRVRSALAAVPAAGKESNG